MDLISPPPTNLVELSDGTSFPAAITATVIPQGLSPFVEVSLEVQEGRPVLTRFAVVRRGPAARVTASDVHDLNVGEIVDDVIRTLAAMAQADPNEVVMGQALRDEEAAERAAALSKNRRPVTDSQLRQAANIAHHNPLDPRKQVAAQLYTSERTASRWLAEARKRGFLTDEENENA
jgi:hypothetical protein